MAQATHRQGSDGSSPCLFELTRMCIIWESGTKGTTEC